MTEGDYNNQICITLYLYTIVSKGLANISTLKHIPLHSLAVFTYMGVSDPAYTCS